MDFRFTPRVFLGYGPSHHGYCCLDISTDRLYIARHVCFNESQFPFDIPKITSSPPSKTSPYYPSESPYVIPTIDHPSPSSPRSPISSPLSVSHLSLTSQTSLESSNGQPSPVSPTSIPPPPPTPPPPLPPITRQCPANIRNNKGTIDNIICQLGSAFALKDLWPLNYFLVIEIVPHVSDILLSQKKYILELLQSAGLSNCNPVSSPMVTASSFSLDDSTAFSNLVKYRQVVGSLQYVTLSRPDIAFAVNKVISILLLKLSPQDADYGCDSDESTVPRGISIYLCSNLYHGTTSKQPYGFTFLYRTDQALADTVC
ncbi:retrovirus-related pol polyprotein from transposon TNT 1-94 [Tanacetum coccineum]